MAYRKDVEEGRVGKTAQLWITYMDHIHLLQSLVESVKQNNFELYVHTLNLMTDLFFSFGGQNFARYLTYMDLFLANIDHSHPGARDLLKQGAISVARSFVPGNGCDVDKTMEETFMKHAKSKGWAGGSGAGASGLLTNYNAYQMWIRTTHARSLYLDATLHAAGIEDRYNDDASHRDLRPTEIQRSEKLVANTESAILGYNNPFDVDNWDDLVILSSGTVATDEVARDFLHAEELGSQAKAQFITRLESGADIFEPIKRLNFQTLDDMSKKIKVTNSQQKVVQFKQQGNVSFSLFLKIDFEELISYPLASVPYSISTPDGALAKTDKSKSMHHLLKDVESVASPQRKDTLTIHDGYAFLYYLKEVPHTFGQISS